MTYRAGVGPNLAKALGISDDVATEPTLTCDVVGCDTRIVVSPVRGGAPAWLRNGRAPRGWRRFPQPDDRPAQHTCPECTRMLVNGGLLK